MAVGLAAAGAKVAVLARSADQVQQTAALAGRGVLALPADVADTGQVAAALDAIRNRWGPVEVLVNNAAAVWPLGPSATLDPDDWAAALAVNATAAARGARAFDTAAKPGHDDPAYRGTPDFVRLALAAADLPAELADALDDESFDAELRRETDEALSLTGKDVGTPIIHFQPPDGVAFFGPVIRRLPSQADAALLWDHVIGLAAFPGFAELKRSLRERPQLASFGVQPGQTGVQEDWHAGSRRPKK